MTVPHISPREAARLAETSGALLVDIREPDEYRAQRIVSAVLRPLSALEFMPPEADPAAPMVFFCHSGRRANDNEALIKARGQNVSIMDGGIAAWKEAGLPVVEVGGPPPLMRQVHIAAGSIILLSLLAAQAASGWLWVTAFVGAGLLFAGLTGFCGMARLLMRMPWNRKKK